VTPAAHVAVAAVRGYQWTLRPLIGGQCRFFPSCSDYAIDALRTHGAARGSALAAWRILRCNPWCEGGFDPVPPNPGAADAVSRTQDDPSPVVPSRRTLRCEATDAYSCGQTRR
jgi:putative membrane protein insertion efficiency factor